MWTLLSRALGAFFILSFSRHHGCDKNLAIFLADAFLASAATCPWAGTDSGLCGGIDRVDRDWLAIERVWASKPTYAHVDRAHGRFGGATVRRAFQPLGAALVSVRRQYGGCIGGRVRCQMAT